MTYHISFDNIHIIKILWQSLHLGYGGYGSPSPDARPTTAFLLAEPTQSGAAKARSGPLRSDFQGGSLELLQPPRASMNGHSGPAGACSSATRGRTLGAARV